MWQKRDRSPVRDAFEYLEYNKGNYWTGERMVEHAKSTALPIFQYVFPGCQSVWAFDNATNHSAYDLDVLVVTRMNLGFGGQQPHMKETWDYNRNLSQTMSFPTNYPEFEKCGEAKGIKQVLTKRRLWPVQGW